MFPECLCALVVNCQDAGKNKEFVEKVKKMPTWSLIAGYSERLESYQERTGKSAQRDRTS
ncbi:hypothetical protein H6F83_03285 [Coleofasciculus sp. FACHB-125]|uniref:hypothetical protein n=1 Tax=Coleofasciculus sp. FACHB-125 TaxID=2692784 RepID=UPI001689C8E2|nr:hypothetical protein [Coleofasciculus sp. FACHB-125]MBD1898991.1 hypothetical protein [Coleofasciculus sp. FACHB-125]